MKFLLLLSTLALSFTISAQEKDSSLWSSSTFSGLKFRSIGPALMSGRISDIAIHPEKKNTWYIGVGSGGVWKTENSGTTWSPLFDEQKSYSIGCITIDPNNPSTIWVGTGENVGGRHVGYGDGIYRSTNGGKSWKNMGLKESQHISKIIVHPKDANTIWVAVQGPLWNKGGERGLYKSSDGGETWKKTLGDNEWVGVTDVVIDPRDPNRLYAATWQRHRNVAAYMGGGPRTGLHRSNDGGETWEELQEGLPKSNMGKIGLAISPQQPDVLYAAIELDLRKGGVYKSTDRGANWKKMSDAVSGATGPHYYQELYASPHAFDRIYLMDVRMQVSDNGGKNFRRVKHDNKHSDNHAIAFRMDDPDYLLVGCDGGLYETFDLAENWHFFANLPLTQYYKLAVDDAEPFYNIYGGTQDNNTQGGPSRTNNIQGIQNSDWKVVLGGDGHQPATEPGNPNILYAQWQQGNLNRIDMSTGELMSIRPQPEAGAEKLRFNWDAPILVSPHSPTRIYFAAQTLFRSDDRGDSWTTISGDLTKELARIEQPLMGRKQSWDNPWDLYAMSQFSTITCIAESPVQANLLYVGSDDGLIHVSENGGESWRMIKTEELPGAPANAYVNNIVTDLYDANKVYVAVDAHKYGDLEPYLFVSEDKGVSWRSISNGIPERTLVWRIVQDHENKDLLFIGTEFGVYFSVNGGDEWIKLSAGMPTIPVRDLTIQRRENDLVVSTFGRSFYILDDLSPLRELSEEQLNNDATLFPLRDAWWYIPRASISFWGQKGAQGASHFVSDNPPHGAVFTYYLNESLKTKNALRKESEKKLNKDLVDVPFPGWEALEAERLEEKPKILLTVRNMNGDVVRRLEGPSGKGFHRVAWDMRYPSTGLITLGAKEGEKEPAAHLAAPGKYTVALSKKVEGVITDLSEVQEFELKPLLKGTLEGGSVEKVAAFWRTYEETSRRVRELQKQLSNDLKTADAMAIALKRSTAPTGDLDKALHQLEWIFGGLIYN